MKQIKKNWMKHFLQWGVLLTIIIFLTKIFGNESPDPEAYCPMGGIQTLLTYLVQGSMACSMTMVQIMLGAVLALGVILFGKLFCSYVCPLGLVNELFFRLRRKLKMKVISIPRGSIVDKALRIIKYVLLFIIFYNTIGASELFCKNFDPYYAFATGFQGELSVWMASLSIGVLFLGGLLVDMFWCKYICPLGGLSNIFKFTLTFVGVVALYAILVALGLEISWVVPLAVLCVVGYLLEIICNKPKVSTQILAIHRDADKCNDCGLCEKKCPYNINIASVKKVTCVDCTNCGECVAVCNKKALTVGKKPWGKYLPLFIVVALFFLGIWMGGQVELPTIDVQWNMEKVEDAGDLTTIKVEGLKSVKCYGSSMALKGRLERIAGTHGLKMFVKKHYAMVTFDPKVISEDKLRETMFTPTQFKISTPKAEVDSVKVVTFRAEGLHDKMDANYLGLQFRQTKRKIYGLETEYACPIIVRLYVDPTEELTKDFLKEITEKELLTFEAHGGKVTEIECGFEFVELEEGESTMALRPYLEKMFAPFNVTFKNGKGVDPATVEIVEFEYAYFDTPLIRRNLPYLSNWLSQQDGTVGIQLVLNKNNTAAIQIKYVKGKYTPESIKALVNKETWTINYGKDNLKEEPRKIEIKVDGVVIE